MSSVYFRVSYETTSTQLYKGESGEEPRGVCVEVATVTVFRNRVPLELQSLELQWRSGSERMWSNKLEEALGHAQQRAPPPPPASFPKRLTSVLNHPT